MPTHGSHSHLEVVVIGAGQAGLTIGYFLSQQERDFAILEAAAEPAAAWKQRWESLNPSLRELFDVLEQTESILLAGAATPESGEGAC